MYVMQSNIIMDVFTFDVWHTWYDQWIYIDPEDCQMSRCLSLTILEAFIQVQSQYKTNSLQFYAKLQSNMSTLMCHHLDFCNHSGKLLLELRSQFHFPYCHITKQAWTASNSAQHGSRKICSHAFNYHFLISQ